MIETAWALRWWIITAVLLATVGLQTYRLQGAQSERDILALEKTERVRRDAMREATNERNKERTNEETIVARKRAAAVVVRIDGPGIKPGHPFDVAAGGDRTPACFDRGRFRDELDGWAARTAERLAAVLQRDAGRLEGVARAGEGVAADYRACRAWALNLVELPQFKDAAGEASAALPMELGQSLRAGP